ncbi:MAG: hypothetical protein GEU28_04405 [Dehalococcoidia bacterium]|nr:hypothetical protein [Dehalococcoidia bacterium]
MDEPPAGRNLRVAPVLIAETYDLPEAPGAGTVPAVQDAFRQTRFLLGDDLRCFKQAMLLQIQVQQASYPSKYRTRKLAAITLYWSRAFSAQRDALLLITRGAYSSVPPLVRAAAGLLAAQVQLHRGGMAEFDHWLDNTLLPEISHQALGMDLGRQAVEPGLAADDRLAMVHRAASDLAGPAFGASLLLTASESNQQRVMATFADQAFHVGFAELMLGWLLRLQERQLALILDMPGVFVISDETRQAALSLRDRIDDRLADAGRCRMDEIEIDGKQRYLLVNFRRSATSASRKLML